MLSRRVPVPSSTIQRHTCDRSGDVEVELETVTELCTAVSTAPLRGTRIDLRGRTVLQPTVSTAGSDTWRALCIVPRTAVATRSNVSNALVSPSHPGAGKHICVVAAGGTKIVNGTLELGDSGILLVDDSCTSFKLKNVTLKGMLPSHSATCSSLESARTAYTPLNVTVYFPSRYLTVFPKL